MTQFLPPDSPPAGYYVAGLIRNLTTADFFKCATCRRFQRHTGELWAAQQNQHLIELVCGTCLAKGVWAEKLAQGSGR